MGGQEVRNWDGDPETFHDAARRRLMFWGGVSGEADGGEMGKVLVVYWELNCFVNATECLSRCIMDGLTNAGKVYIVLMGALSVS